MIIISSVTVGYIKSIFQEMLSINVYYRIPRNEEMLSILSDKVGNSWVGTSKSHII